MCDPNEICSGIAYLAQTYLGLEKWGFQERVRLNEMDGLKIPLVTYDSQWCRMKISFSEWNPPHQSQEYTVDFYYGRLNAPNDRSTFIWNSEECHCWHGVVKALHFIDRSTPEHAAQNLFSHDLIKQFRSMLSAKDLPYKLPEWEIRKHAYIWERYAPRLFELFDLRRPDLWEQYRKFLKEVYDIKGRSPNIKPPLNCVC